MGVLIPNLFFLIPKRELSEFHPGSQDGEPALSDGTVPPSAVFIFPIDGAGKYLHWLRPPFLRHAPITLILSFQLNRRFGVFLGLTGASSRLPAAAPPRGRWVLGLQGQARQTPVTSLSTSQGDASFRRHGNPGPNSPSELLAFTATVFSFF